MKDDMKDELALVLITLAEDETACTPSPVGVAKGKAKAAPPAAEL